MPEHSSSSVERSAALFVASLMSFPVVALCVRMQYKMCVSTVGYARAGAAVTARGSSRAASAGGGADRPVRWRSDV